MPAPSFVRDVAIVGGCGRAGLPLAVAFASRGLTVTAIDTNQAAVAMVAEGRMPFQEVGAAPLLEAATRSGLLTSTVDLSALRTAEYVVVVVGTPLGADLKPDPSVLPGLVAACASHLLAGQTLVLRSTVHPGGTRLVERELAARGVAVDVAFCPERIAEGEAMTELFALPQIVAARDVQVRARTSKLFAMLTDRVIELEPEEAELAKLFTNAWRYVKFATANQFWVLANDAGLDFERIREAITTDYPRAADLPRPGFTAGPCLLKDTLQLASSSGDDFVLGHAAMTVNEGLPNYLVKRLERRFDLSQLTVGILGMAFKGGSDDPRESLAYKLRDLLTIRAAVTLCSDIHIADDRFVDTAELLRVADLVVIAAPHPEYRVLETDVPVIDIWGLTGRPPVV